MTLAASPGSPVGVVYLVHSPSPTGTRGTTPAGPPTWRAGSPSTRPDAARDYSK